MMLADRLRNAVREVPDFPKPGISFKDITPIFLDPILMTDTAAALAAHWQGKGVTKVVGIDSRGFLFGGQMAQQLGCGLVLARKKGKLPPETVSVSYELEYGTAEIESVTHAIQPGDRVVIHDDLLATGGTALAAVKLMQMLGAEVVGFSFMIELSFLDGRKRLEETFPDVHAVLIY